MTENAVSVGSGARRPITISTDEEGRRKIEQLLHMSKSEFDIMIRVSRILSDERKGPAFVKLIDSADKLESLHESASSSGWWKQFRGGAIRLGALVGALLASLAGIKALLDFLNTYGGQ